MAPEKKRDVIVKYTGQKISKLRWCPGKSSQRQFISGGWDDKRCLLTLWQTRDADHSSEEPFVLDEVHHSGSISDLCFLSTDRFVSASSVGDVAVYSVVTRGNIIKHQKTWQRLHYYQATGERAACTCVAANGSEILTGGEDGRVNFLQVESGKPLRVLEADNANVTGLQFLGSREMVTVNSTGQLKVWDLRKQGESPAKILTLSGSSCPLLSVDKHPNQPHILVTGHGDGVIGIWDIRQDSSPVTLIDAHEGEVWEVRFHSLYPDNLFTCSEDGSCWFWDGASMISEASYTKHGHNLFGEDVHEMQSAVSSSVWLYVDANKHRMQTFSLAPFNRLPVNTFDVDGSSLICGTDGEVVMVVRDIPVK